MFYIARNFCVPYVSFCIDIRYLVYIIYHVETKIYSYLWRSLYMVPVKLNSSDKEINTTNRNTKGAATN